MSLSVGQQLWWVSNQRWAGPNKYVTVAKVGRKWATLECGKRIDMQTLVADGGDYSPSGYCVLSKEAHEAECERQRVWQEFHRRSSHNAPDGLTVEEIEAFAAKCGIEMPEEST
jgi:hypothetical protein